MNLSAIPQQDGRSPQMAGKLAEERADVGTCPVAHVEIEVQAEAMAHRATVSPRWRRLCHVGSYPEAATCARQAPRSCARWESAGPRVPPRRARSRSRPRTRSSSFFSTSPSPRCSLPEGRLLRDDDQPVPGALRHVRIVARRVLTVVPVGWTTTAQPDIYAFSFDQAGAMAGLGLRGSKITKINP